LAAVPAFADPSLSAKQAQARQVMAQLQSLNGSLEQAVQRYDLAKLKYAKVQRQVTINRNELKVAKKNLVVGQARIKARLLSLYTTPKDSTLEVILGAKSLDDLLNRMDTARSVTSQDSEVINEVRQFKTAVKRNGAQLAHARVEARRLLNEKAAKRRQIESQLAQEHRLLSSVQGQIAQILAAQQARALQMANEARARLQQQQLQAQANTQNTVVGVTASAPSNDSSTESIVAPPSSVGGGAVGAAMAQINKPYVWAAAGPDSFDCSGLVMYAYAQVGVSLPHSSYAQWGMGVPVSRDQLEPGDLVFFDGLGHVGMYIGGDQFVQAPHTGTVVQVTSMEDPYYAASYVGARRIL
jgi:cell wall-associated NlpC family hydrolase